MHNYIDINDNMVNILRKEHQYKTRSGVSENHNSVINVGMNYFFTIIKNERGDVYWDIKIKNHLYVRCQRI